MIGALLLLAGTAGGRADADDPSEALQRIIAYSVPQDAGGVPADASGYTLADLDADIGVLERSFAADPDGTRAYVELAAEVLQTVTYVDLAAKGQQSRPQELIVRGKQLETRLGHVE